MDDTLKKYQEQLANVLEQVESAKEQLVVIHEDMMDGWMFSKPRELINITPMVTSANRDLYVAQLELKKAINAIRIANGEDPISILS